MTLRRPAAVVLLLVAAAPSPAPAATYTTQNFVVTAPDENLARKFGDMAEQYRREKAQQWLGQEMPPWSRRCPLRVQITDRRAGGATTFTFGSDGNRPVVNSQHMDIHGPVRQLLNSVLPHEITHTVLAYHFGRPVPRWADEGGSVLSENDEERFSHDIRCRELLNGGRGIRLRVLFRMTEYPDDMLVLYAQGYSITDYLVRRGGDGQEGRAKLLQFLGYGMQGNTPDTWNAAASRVYGIDGIDAMEAAWLDALKTPPSRIAARGGNAPATPTGRPGLEYASTTTPRTDVRNSSAPAVPVLEPPVRAVRGATPGDEPVNRGMVGRTLPVSAPGVPCPTGTCPTVRPMAPETPPPAVLLPPEIPRR
jgi:hypothetical protein